jgi:hypothetical protein
MKRFHGSLSKEESPGFVWKVPRPSLSSIGFHPPTRRLRHPWRTLFLTLPLAEAGGGLPLDTRCDPESLELLLAESLRQQVGRHVVCWAPYERDDLGLEEFASVLVGDIDVLGPLGVGAVLG